MKLSEEQVDQLTLTAASCGLPEPGMMLQDAQADSESAAG